MTSSGLKCLLHQCLLLRHCLVPHSHLLSTSSPIPSGLTSSLSAQMRSGFCCLAVHFREERHKNLQIYIEVWGTISQVLPLSQVLHFKRQHSVEEVKLNIHTNSAKLIWGCGGHESFLVSVDTRNYWFSIPGSYKVGICAISATAMLIRGGASLADGREADTFWALVRFG